MAIVERVDRVVDSGVLSEVVAIARDTRDWPEKLAEQVTRLRFIGRQRFAGTFDKAKNILRLK